MLHYTLRLCFPSFFFCVCVKMVCFFFSVFIFVCLLFARLCYLLFVCFKLVLFSSFNAIIVCHVVLYVLKILCGIWWFDLMFILFYFFVFLIFFFFFFYGFVFYSFSFLFWFFFWTCNWQGIKKQSSWVFVKYK